MEYVDHEGFNIMMLLGRWRQLSMRRRRRGSSRTETGGSYSSWVVIDFVFFLADIQVGLTECGCASSDQSEAKGGIEEVLLC
jgi:hypothetical protein